MARINIEDSLFKDQRFFKLALKLGGAEIALGVLVMAWVLAQKYWTTVNDRLIPFEKWKQLSHWELLLEYGLAELKDDKVYVCGSKTQFNWLEQRQNAGRNNKGKSRKRPLTTVKRNQTGENGIKRVETSYSSSYSSSPSFSSSNSNSENLKKIFHEAKAVAGEKFESPEKVSSVSTWEAYAFAYEERYGTAPVRNASVNGKLIQFIKRVGIEEAPAIAKFYLTHSDSFYIRQMHPVGALLKDAEKLRTEWITGKKMTQQNAKTFDKEAAWEEQARRIANGEL